MSEKRRPGRPGKPDAEKKKPKTYKFSQPVVDRFEKAVPAYKRGVFIEKAITLLLDIKEGKRKLPEISAEIESFLLNNTSEVSPDHPSN